MLEKRQEASAPPVELTRALEFFLMTGTYSLARMPGWVNLAQETDIEALAEAAWQQHGPALTATAQAAGFEPWAATGRRPGSPALAAWKRNFEAKHTY